MSRRTMMVQAVRKKLKQQRDPIIIVLPTWACKDGEPLVTWRLDHREPTEVELVAAIVNAGYTEAVAATAAAKIVAAREKTKPNP
jgi:hypothetical protein